MTEYSKMKARQAEQLGSIDDVHPLKQVAIMSIIQVLMLAIVGVGMFFIGLNYPDKEIPINYIDDVSNEQTKTIS
jgi:hypothetical protein|tara:strand:- start:401 stop:625 length:225 start_codon:yes stop_codon:yes gene_type:complete